MRGTLPSTLSWVVPVDDTRCFSIGWSDIDKELAIPGRAGYVDRRSGQGAYVVGAGDVGQTGAPAYEERQRARATGRLGIPGPVTLHSREHLGTTDRGVIMYRKLVRQGIRAVAEGNAPKGLQFEGTGERPTCCNNTVARIPAPADPEADRRLRIAFGREVTKRILAYHNREARSQRPCSGAPSPASLARRSASTLKSKDRPKP